MFQSKGELERHIVDIIQLYDELQQNLEDLGKYDPVTA
jgi:hypothetical protein